MTALPRSAPPVLACPVVIRRTSLSRPRCFNGATLVRADRDVLSQAVDDASIASTGPLSCESGWTEEKEYFAKFYGMLQRDRSRPRADGTRTRATCSSRTCTSFNGAALVRERMADPGRRRGPASTLSCESGWSRSPTTSRTRSSFNGAALVRERMVGHCPRRVRWPLGPALTGRSRWRADGDQSRQSDRDHAASTGRSRAGADGL
jgi:hypothetical protein